MKHSVLLYLRCAVANRFTLVGYVMLTTAAVMMCVLPGREVPTALLWIGYGFLASTSYGLETYQAYRRVLQSADRFGEADERVVDRYHVYCGRTGARLAQKDLARSSNKARTE